MKNAIEDFNKTRAEIISEIIDDITRSVPIIKNLFESVSLSINSGKYEEAHKILESVITTLFLISQMISALEEEVGEKIEEIKINGEDITTVQKRWIEKLEELKRCVVKNDMVKVGDIIAYELPIEIEKQVEILKKLIEKGK